MAKVLTGIYFAMKIKTAEVIDFFVFATSHECHLGTKTFVDQLRLRYIHQPFVFSVLKAIFLLHCILIHVS